MRPVGPTPAAYAFGVPTCSARSAVFLRSDAAGVDNRTMPLATTLRRALCAVPLLLAASVLPAQAGGVVDDTPPPSWQVEGPIYGSTVVRDTVYVGRRFTQIVSSTGETQPRSRLAAFSISTGEPLAWSPEANGVVWSLESDEKTVWAGGEFTEVGGRSAQRLVKLSAGTGAVDKKFDVSLNDTVRALEVQHGMLYVGGLFTTVNGRSQAYLTKVAANSGAVPRGFNPQLEDMVRDIVAPPAGNGNDHQGTERRDTPRPSLVARASRRWNRVRSPRSR